MRSKEAKEQGQRDESAVKKKTATSGKKRKVQKLSEEEPK